MTLERHQLVRLTDAGWRSVLTSPWDEQARACLAHWSRQDLPLVTTRQRSARRLALGLPAPLCFDRRRIAFDVHADAVAGHERFPRVAAIVAALPAELHGPWAALCDALARQGCRARVHGSFGWQVLSGMAYLHDASDIDLLLPVESAAHADALCARLEAAPPGLPRLDGELAFPDGAGIAWREWAQWRRGRVTQVLVKRIDRVAMEVPPSSTGAPAC